MGMSRRPFGLRGENEQDNTLAVSRRCCPVDEVFTTLHPFSIILLLQPPTPQKSLQQEKFEVFRISQWFRVACMRRGNSGGGGDFLWNSTGDKSFSSECMLGICLLFFLQFLFFLCVLTSDNSGKKYGVTSVYSNFL